MGVYVAENPQSTRTSRVESARLRVGGMTQDTHYGSLRNAGAREKKEYEKGTPLFNERQVSVLEYQDMLRGISRYQAIIALGIAGMKNATPEELAAQGLPFSEMPAQWEQLPEMMGANLLIALQGINHLDDSFSSYPIGTRLFFDDPHESNALKHQSVLFLTAENMPCHIPDALIRENNPALPEGSFQNAFMGERGVVAIVEQEGIVTQNDVVRVQFPGSHKANSVRFR